MKTAKQMERHVKGIANHYRIKIIFEVYRQPGITLDEIIDALGGNAKTIGAHARRLAIAGLVQKRYRGKCVEHSLTPYGKQFVAFLREFQNQS